MRSTPRWSVLALSSALVLSACSADTGAGPGGTDRDAAPRDMGTGGGDGALVGTVDDGVAAMGDDGGAPGDDGVVADDAGGTLGDDAGMSMGSGGEEICDNELDDDGDGQVDEGCTCLPNTQGACWPGPIDARGVGACADGTRRCSGDEEIGTWSACEGAHLPSMELCDSIDNDCDGMVDESCSCPVGMTRACYTGPAGTVNVGLCRLGMQTCVDEGAGASWGPCEGVVTPAREICDRRDNDCDGRVDEDCECTPNATRSCYGGPSGSAGRGVCRAGTQTCRVLATGGSAWGDCTGETRPVTELCDDRVDNDCDGVADCMDPECASATPCLPVCMPGTQRFELMPSADVLFLIDRSSSMSSSTGDGRNRWDALRTAVRAVLPGLDGSLHMGMLIFPYPSGCTVPTTPNVAVTQPSAEAIRTALEAGGPAGSTPTLAALRNAQSYFRANATGRTPFIVLATDGEPNCSGDVNAVVTQLTTLRSEAGVDTFVLGIPGSSSSLRTSLNRMAVAGGRARAGTTQFYSADSTAEFESALRAITSAVGCTFSLARPPADPSGVTLFVDGRALTRGRTDGWDFVDTTNRRIQFYGGACTGLGDGRSHTVTADYRC